jgi:hypothetical protein
MSVRAGCAREPGRQLELRDGAALGQLHPRDVAPARPEVDRAILRNRAGLPQVGVVHRRRGGQAAQEDADARSGVLQPAVIQLAAAAHREIVAGTGAPQLDPHQSRRHLVEYHRLFERQRPDLDGGLRMKLHHGSARDLDISGARQDALAPDRMFLQHPQVLAGVTGFECRAVVAVHLQPEQGVRAGQGVAAQVAAADRPRRHALVAPDAPVNAQAIGA